MLAGVAENTDGDELSGRTKGESGGSERADVDERSSKSISLHFVGSANDESKLGGKVDLSLRGCGWSRERKRLTPDVSDRCP